VVKTVHPQLYSEREEADTDIGFIYIENWVIQKLKTALLVTMQCMHTMHSVYCKLRWMNNIW
jgi:hypothetical protein